VPRGGEQRSTRAARGAGTAGGAREWTAGALVFSGRPDPAWTLDADAVDGVRAALDALPPPEPVPAARGVSRRLGYRGSFVAAPDGRRWTAFAGFVHEDPAPRGGARRVVRRDDGRVLERAILATAPPGALPPGVADDAV